MKKLIDFVRKHAVRGDCTCGRCVDGAAEPKQPNGHTADMVFFKVAARDNPDPKQLEELIRESKSGEFVDVDLFDGKEHGYIELGGWIGDQGLAIMLMGLGGVLNLWKLLTPYTIPGMTGGLARQVAESGFLSIQAKTPVKGATFRPV